MAHVEHVAFVFKQSRKDLAARSHGHQVVANQHIARIRPHVDLRVDGLVDVHRVVVEKGALAGASNLVVPAKRRKPEDFALLVPRLSVWVLPVSVVDADVVPVSTIDVVPQNLGEPALVVEAQVVLNDNVFAAVVDVRTVRVLGSVGIHQAVVLDDDPLTFEGPCAASTRPHAIVDARACVVEQAVFYDHMSRTIGHEP